jgi:excisionase family DNA binding protein
MKKKSKMKSGDVLTTTQVAEILGASVGSVNKWVDAGYFPNAYRLNPMRPRSGWRIPRGDIDLFIKKRREQRGFFYMPDLTDHIFTDPPDDPEQGTQGESRQLMLMEM